MSRLLTVLFCALVATCLVAPAAQGAYTLSLAPSPASPLVDGTVTVTASGNADTSSDLWWYYEESGTSCATSRDSESARLNAYTLGAEFGFAGPYSKQGQFQPDKGVPYRVCAYLYDENDNTGGLPRASATTTVTPTFPPSTVGLTFSPAAPRVNDTVTVTATGTAGLDSHLHWYYHPDGADCATTNGNESARVDTRSLDLFFPSAGPFSVQGQFRPDRAVTYRICSYIYYGSDNEDTQPPRALGVATITVAPPPPPPDRDGDGVTDPSDTCPDTAASTPTGCPGPVVPPASKPTGAKSTVPTACRRLRRSKRSVCIKRAKALAKCKKVKKAKKRAACVRKAKAIKR